MDLEATLTREEKKVAYMKNFVKLGGIYGVSLGVVTVVGGALLLVDMGFTYAPPAAIGLVMLLLGVASIIGGLWVFRRYSLYMREKRRAQTMRMEAVSRGEASTKAYACFQGQVWREVMIPTELLERVEIKGEVEWGQLEGEQDPNLPKFEMVPGLLVSDDACMMDELDVDHGCVEYRCFYSFAALAYTFIFTAILIFAIVYPEVDPTITILCAVFGGVGALCILPAAYCFIPAYCDYKRT